MYPKDKKTAALMSETIREVLTNEELFQTICSESDEVPKYFDMLPTKDGITAMATALMIKGMSGDVAAFTALSKFGFGEKVQMEVSDFYRTGKIDIQVVPPQDFDSTDNVAPGEIIPTQITEGEHENDPTTSSGIEQRYAELGQGASEEISSED